MCWKALDSKRFCPALTLPVQGIWPCGLPYLVRSSFQDSPHKLLLGFQMIWQVGCNVLRWVEVILFFWQHKKCTSRLRIRTHFDRDLHYWSMRKLVSCQSSVWYVIWHGLNPKCRCRRRIQFLLYREIRQQISMREVQDTVTASGPTKNKRQSDAVRNAWRW